MAWGTGSPAVGWASQAASDRRLSPCKPSGEQRIHLPPRWLPEGAAAMTRGGFPTLLPGPPGHPLRRTTGGDRGKRHNKPPGPALRNLCAQNTLDSTGTRVVISTGKQAPCPLPGHHRRRATTCTPGAGHREIARRMPLLFMPIFCHSAVPAAVGIVTGHTLLQGHTPSVPALPSPPAPKRMVPK